MKLKNIDIRVGSVTTNGKFIVSKEGENTLVFNAVDYPKDGNLRHREIAEKSSIALDAVVGGGEIKLDMFNKTTLNLTDFSSEFGGVPKEILDAFGPELLSVYQKNGTNIQSVKTDGYTWTHVKTRSSRETSIDSRKYQEYFEE